MLCAENSKPWAPGTHGITTKYWSKRTKRPGIRMSDFIKPILNSGRHRLFTLFMQGCFQWKISLFPPPPCLCPSNLSGSPLSYFSWSFLLCYTCACTWNTQSSAGIILCGSATLSRGIPLLSLVVFEMNKFVQSARVWIQRLIFPWQAATTHVPKQDETFISASTEAGRWRGEWHPPGYSRTQGAAAFEQRGSNGVFIIYWLYTKAHTTHHHICFAGSETSKHH